jgi:hypothetical protein
LLPILTSICEAFVPVTGTWCAATGMGVPLRPAAQTIEVVPVNAA